MATTYILPRGTEITRARVLESFNVFLSDEDMSDVSVTLQNAESVGINANGRFCWVHFGAMGVAFVEKYGSGNGESIEHFEQTLGVRLISEHDEDFSYHSFPVDVRDPNVQPIAKKDGWEVFEDCGWCYLYNRATNVFYEHVQCEAAEMNIDAMISEAE